MVDKKDFSSNNTYINESNISNDPIPQLTNILQPPSTEKRQEPFVNLFISFDIANSTEFKVRSKSFWPTMLKAILAKTIQDFGVKYEYEFWRTIGDEAVFTKRIEKIEDIYIAAHFVFQKLNELNTEIKNGKLFENNTDIPEAQRTGHNLSLKATLWIADLSENAADANNIFTTYSGHSTSTPALLDYFGPDIDTGFRIAKYSAPNRLAISFEVAMLLLNYTKYVMSKNTLSQDLSIQNDYILNDITEKIHLISMVELKGVWDKRKYPIIWYHESCDVKFIDSFEYDALDKNDISKEYMQNINSENVSFAPDFFRDTGKSLQKIYDNLNLFPKVEKLYNLIKPNTNLKEQSLLNSMELHAACVCFCNNDSETEASILIVKREKTSKWEFGCAKLNKNESMIDTIKKEYKRSFDIDLDILNDEEYADSIIPYVISVYEHPELDGTTSKGIIFVAEIINYSKDSLNINDDKFSEHKFLKESELEDFNDETVSGFKNTLKKCFNHIKEKG